MGTTGLLQRNGIGGECASPLPLPFLFLLSCAYEREMAVFFSKLSFFVLLILLTQLLQCAQAATKAKAKADPDDNKGNTPFFLQDDSDR